MNWKLESDEHFFNAITISLQLSGWQGKSSIGLHTVSPLFYHDAKQFVL